ncbi:MAG: hypothetical protein ACI4BH_11655 [Muribaculaceae bacterium]
MKQTKYLFSVVCFLLLTTACNETFDEINTQKLPLATRSVYDNEVRWDSTEYLQYKLNTDEILNNLIVPWAQGSTSSIGIPSEWYDQNYLNPNASNRNYTSNPFLQYNDEIIANFNITTIADHYEKYWTTGLKVANNDIYYRVSFDLVSSTDGKTYSFSKYFKPKIVRRTFYPTDTFI